MGWPYLESFKIIHLGIVDLISSVRKTKKAGERREDNIQRQFRDFNLTGHPGSRMGKE